MKPIRSIVKKQLPEIDFNKCLYHKVELDENKDCPLCLQEREQEREKERLLELKWQEEERIKEEERCRKIAENPEPLLEKIGIGARHLTCSFDNYKGGEKIKNICTDVVKEPCDLILTGSAGSGKTHLAVAIFREWIKNQTIKTVFDDDEYRLLFNAVFITVPDLLLQIRRSFKDDSKVTEEQIVRRYSQRKYLILDDLGSEKTTDWSITTLYTIIDRRYRDMNPTIVTTNLTIDEIGAQISERIASRLSSGKVIKINAPDYRKKR